MLSVCTFFKSALTQIYHNMICSCSYAASSRTVLLFIFVFSLSDVFIPGAAIELCGGIRNRFVCDDQDPTVFHICLGNNQYTMVCPGTLHFNVRTQNCDWPKYVNCVEEARSRQTAGTFLPELTPSPTLPKGQRKVTHPRDFPPKARPLPSSTNSPVPTTSELNSTERNMQASHVPTKETTSTEAPHSRYRLKAVPGLDKPLESLLPADEKVIEEVKKLSEELKQIDNYLQSLDSDQIGFMIEPYMAAFPRRRPSYSSRYINAASRKYVPSFSPYRRRWNSSASPQRKVTSPSPYRIKTTRYTYSRPGSHHTTSRVSRGASTAPRTSSPYKPTTRLYHAVHVPTAYRRHYTSAPTTRYSTRFSNVENNSERGKGNPYQNPQKVNKMFKSHSGDFNSSSNKQYKFTSSGSELGHGARKLTPRVTLNTDSPRHSTTNLVSPRHYWNQNSNKSVKSDEERKSARFHYTSSSTSSHQPIKYRQLDTRVTQPSSQLPKSRVIPRARHATFKSRLPSRDTTWWSTARSTASSASTTAHSAFKSTATTSPVKYTQATHTLHKSVTDNVPASSTSYASPWWSSAKLDYTSTNDPQMSRHFNRRKYKPRHDLPRPNYNTRIPNVDFALIPVNDRSTSYMSNMKQNGQMDRYIIAPAAVERNFALHNSARAPFERNFALHNSARAPTAEERNFSLHKVNAAASADRFPLHNPHHNPQSKIDAASEISKVFALHKPDENSKEKEISAYKSPVEKYETKRGKCSSSWCKLPDCRCIGSEIPGELDSKDIPQMVMLTFDDSINSQNMHYFRGIFNGTLKNPNGCPIKSTFFVSGDNSDYDMVKRIYKQGHEIASHTLSHRNPTTWWAYAGYQNWEHEVVGMRDRLNEKSGVPVKGIIGMRAPFLQVGGDAQYAMLKENKFRYDSSMVTGNLYLNSQPPVWPFTLDTPPDGTTCSLTPCPTRSYPGLWEVPLIRWYGSNKMACAMPDACTIDLGTKGSRKFMEENFNRHYTTNRAPFGIFIHASWFGRKDGNFQGLYEFLASLAEKEDVWVVTLNQMLDWVQRPVRLSALNALESWAC